MIIRELANYYLNRFGWPLLIIASLSLAAALALDLSQNPGTLHCENSACD